MRVSRKLRKYQLCSLILLVLVIFLSGVVCVQGRVILETTKDLKFLLQLVQEKDRVVSSFMFERAFVLQNLHQLSGQLKNENKKVAILSQQLDKQRAKTEAVSMFHQKKLAEAQKQLTFYVNANNILTQEKSACKRDSINIEIHPDNIELYYQIPVVEIASN